MNESQKSIPEIELEVTSLPSRGLTYPKGAKLKYRTYTFGEIRKASTSTLRMESSIQLALDGVTASFNTKDLTLMDCLYIGILRKVSSLNGMQFEVPFQCTKCNEVAKNHFSQNDISFRDIPEEVTELPIVTTISGQELHFSPMTVGDYLTLKSGTHDGILKEGKVDRVSTQAISIKNMSFHKSYELLYSVTDLEEIEILTEVDKLLLHDIKPLNGVCNNKVEGKVCGEHNNIKLEGREALLTPFRSSEGSTRTRIRFGTTPKSESVSN